MGQSCLFIRPAKPWEAALSMPDILITEFMLESEVDRLAKEYDVSYQPDLVSDQDKIPALMPGVRGLIVRNATQVRGAVLEAADKLECVGRLGVGLDNIDMDACADRGIKVYPAIGANSDSVAELAMGAIYSLFRRAYHSTEAVIAGKWPRLELMGREIQGKTLGIIGYGSIGTQLSVLAEGLGMQVLFYDVVTKLPLGNATQVGSLAELLALYIQSRPTFLRDREELAPLEGFPEQTLEQDEGEAN